MKEKTLIRKIDINAVPAKVWNALINPEMTKQYMFNCEAISDWKPGSELIWKGVNDGKVYVKGKIKSFTPDRVLSFTAFDPNSGLKDIPANYVTTTYRLTPHDHHTELEITDEGFENVEDGERRYHDSEKGWDAVLPKLKEVAEK
jgi:uncharacterized protein YndB with AHSA1/START domain